MAQMYEVPYYLSERESSPVGALESDVLFSDLLKHREEMSAPMRALAALQLPDTDYGLYFEMSLQNTWKAVGIPPTPVFMDSLWVPLTLYSGFALPAARVSYMAMMADPGGSVEAYAARLDPLSRTWIYADALAILDYYSYGNAMLPYAHRATDQGFRYLHGLMVPGVQATRMSWPMSPPFPGLPKLKMDPGPFRDDPKLSFLYFIVATDISWTVDLLQGYWDNMPAFIPFYLKNDQSVTQFFENYSWALANIGAGRPLSVDQYLSMVTILESDVFCYQRWVYGHEAMELLDPAFAKEMHTFVDHLVRVTAMVKAWEIR